MSQAGRYFPNSPIPGQVAALEGNSGGPVDPNASGIIFVEGGNNITTIGNLSANTLTVDVSGTTQYAVQVGNSLGALSSIGVGTSGQVLTSNGSGSNPSFQNAASSNITITGDTGGGLTGTSFTFTGGSTGLTFNGSGTTETVEGTLIVGNGGTGATTLTGVLIGNGASAITGNAITQHDVLVGGASNAITSVAPSSTSGVPLISQGSSSNPAFGTAVVAGGGTGATSLTSHSLLLGNGTSAISALGAATNGQIPIGSTSNAPTLATITAGTGITVTNGAGTITIAASGGGSGITTLDGNSGSATGSTVTVSVTNGGSSEGTPIFTGASAALSLVFTDSNDNVAIGLTAGGNGVTTLPGFFNCILGANSAGSITTGGSYNVLIGGSVAPSVSSGTYNIALGFNALGSSTGSYNIALGGNAGSNLGTSESSNIYLNNAGNSGESNKLRIGAATGTGSQDLNQAYICGITGVVVTGSTTLISTGNQLGVASSSQRFKNDIQDMKSDSEVLYKLRPVSFIWNKNSAEGLKDASDLRQFGLIAEEAVEHIPHAVNLDADGKAFNINYQDLVGMLVNEVQKLNKRIEDLEAK